MTASTETETSTFDVGDRVVYPRHGVGTVTEIRPRQLDGHRTDYLCIDLDSDLVVWLPCETSTDLGLRAPAPTQDAEEALALLTGRGIPIPRGFRPRHKRNERRLRSGEIDEVARVVRELGIRASRRRLSPTECRQLLDARRILEGELASALGQPVESIAAEIDDRLPEPLAPGA